MNAASPVEVIADGHVKINSSVMRPGQQVAFSLGGVPLVAELRPDGSLIVFHVIPGQE